MLWRHTYVMLLSFLIKSLLVVKRIFTHKFIVVTRGLIVRRLSLQRKSRWKENQLMVVKRGKFQYLFKLSKIVEKRIFIALDFWYADISNRFVSYNERKSRKQCCFTNLDIESTLRCLHTQGSFGVLYNYLLLQRPKPMYFFFAALKRTYFLLVMLILHKPKQAQYISESNW